MIDYEKYDVIKDADEEKSHLCNSLNAEIGLIHHIIWNTKNKNIPIRIINSKDLERWADYMERSQNVITYFQLEKQETVKPEPIMGTSICDCGKCKHAVTLGMNYCPVCGCQIDWN